MNDTFASLFSNAGPLLSSWVAEQGQSPMKQFTAMFIHQNYTLTYDGKTWKKLTMN